MSFTHAIAEATDREVVTYPRLPSNIEAEQVVLGACIRSNELVPQVFAICGPDDFADPLHRRIAAAIGQLDGEHRPATAITLLTALGDDPAWKEIDPGYLRNLSYVSDTGSVVLAIAQDIAALAMRRRAIIAIWDAQEELGGPPNRSVSAILAPVVAVCDAAAQRFEASTHGSGSAAVIALRVVDAAQDEEKQDGVSSGLAKLDDVIGAFYPSDLSVVAGRTGMGKSSLGTNLARAAANAGLHVDYFSLEMTRAQLAARLVTDLDYDRFSAAHQRPLSYSRLIRRQMTGVELERARASAELLTALEIDIYDQGSLTIDEIASLSRASQSRRKSKGVVIIDHLHIVRPSRDYDSRHREITEITHRAKELAKQLAQPVVLLAQLNREADKRNGTDRMPTLSDLRESGSIEEDADNVLLLYRPAYYVERKRPALGQADPGWLSWLADIEPVRHRLDIRIEKNRNGAPDTITLWCDIGACAIRDADPHAPKPDIQNSRGFLP